MVSQRQDGRYVITATTTDEELIAKIKTALKNDPELSEGALVRSGVRRELQQREHQ